MAILKVNVQEFNLEHPLDLVQMCEIYQPSPGSVLFWILQTVLFTQSDSMN